MFMKRITLSADGNLIKKAKSAARAQGRTLNTAFREWLVQYSTPSVCSQTVAKLFRQLAHVKAGRHLNRQEMNER